MSAPGSSDGDTDALRREIESLQVEGRQLAAKLDEAERQSAQVAALVREEVDVGSRMEALETALDLAVVTRHVREVVAVARIVETPVRHAVVHALLPEAAGRAARAAIPAPVFAPRGPGGPRDVPLPPRLAPTYAMATWMFLNDVAQDLIGPLLCERLLGWPTPDEQSELRLARSRLVSGWRGEPAEATPPRSDEVLEMLVHLGESTRTACWAFEAGSGDRLHLPSLVADTEEWSYWHVAFTTTRKASRARRRHGDLRSWQPTP